MEANEIFSAVDNINQDLYEKTQNNGFFEEGLLQLEIQSNGDFTKINFCNICIWFNDEDEREFIESINDYESLEPFLRKKVNEIISVISIVAKI